MNYSILNKWSVPFFFSILILVSSCSLDDSTQSIDLTNESARSIKSPIAIPSDYISGNIKARSNWMLGEGWAKGEDILFVTESFGGIEETQNYQATLKDGVLSGTFEYEDLFLEDGSTYWVKGDVICMVFEEDCKSVRMVGMITDSSEENTIGTYAIWIAENNGNEGLDATTDIRSGQPEVVANFHCEIGFSRAAFNIQGNPFFLETEGNIKVKSMDCFGDVTGDNGN